MGKGRMGGEGVWGRMGGGGLTGEGQRSALYTSYMGRGKIPPPRFHGWWAVISPTRGKIGAEWGGRVEGRVTIGRKYQFPHRVSQFQLVAALCTKFQ